MSGEDLDVLLQLDKIMVLCHGKITGIVDAKSVTKEQIGLMMIRKNSRGGRSMQTVKKNRWFV